MREMFSCFAVKTVRQHAGHSGHNARAPPPVLFFPRRMTSAQERKIRQTGCDVRFDNLTRQLYSTDASIYQIHPVGAAFPKTAEQASLVIHATADAGLSITPRGAGTSLVGNAIGDGLIVDFSRYNRQITDLDLENLRHNSRSRAFTGNRVG